MDSQKLEREKCAKKEASKSISSNKYKTLNQTSPTVLGITKVINIRKRNCFVVFVKIMALQNTSSIMTPQSNTISLTAFQKITARNTPEVLMTENRLTN